jgi:multidrug efflux pump subunit AcrA (membrane-fusion protein)
MRNFRQNHKHFKNVFILSLILFASCQSDQETITPQVQDITESVYASGIIKSKNQYQVFATVSGIVNEVFVEEGAIVEAGSPILSLVNDAQKLMERNAKLSADFNSLYDNQGKIDEARARVNLTRSQMKSDSAMLERQKKLWAQNIGTKIALEQRELAFETSKSNYISAQENLKELERQLKFLSTQAQNNLKISSKNNSDFLIRSKIKGQVYQLNSSQGEIVTPQTPIAIIGDDNEYLLEMQVDEYDIVSVNKGMPVIVVLNSYRDTVFNATVSKINPIMNVQSKTFTVEATFVDAPEVLYPNISLEANIVIRTKKDALLIPRNYLLHDSLVVNKSGEELKVKTGLKDYQMVEILSGIDANEELILPER